MELNNQDVKSDDDNTVDNYDDFYNIYSKQVKERIEEIKKDLYYKNDNYK